MQPDSSKPFGGSLRYHDQIGQQIAPPNRRPVFPFRMRSAARTPDSLPVPVVGGGQ
jgi:hypothetical protein